MRLQGVLWKQMSDTDTVEPDLPRRHDILRAAGENETLPGKGFKRQPDDVSTERDLPAPSRSVFGPYHMSKDIPQLRLLYLDIGDPGLCLGQGKQLCLSRNQDLQDLPGPFRNNRP